MKKLLFLAAMSIFITLSTVFYANHAYAAVLRMPRDLASVVLFLTVVLLNYTMPKKKILINKGSKFMLCGMTTYFAFRFFLIGTKTTEAEYPSITVLSFLTNNTHVYSVLKRKVYYCL